MDIIEAVILGIIQGVTEWLPISSTAHLRIAPELFGWSDPGAGFTAVIQLGTLFAVLLFFRSDIVRVFSGWVRSFTDKEQRNTLEAKQGWGIVIGTLPIVIFGVLFQKSIKAELRSLYVVAIALILMGIVLAIAERVGKQARSMQDLTVKDGLWVGLWQAIALIPGASRSGSTIAGGLFAGLDRESAARYSFLLSIPSIAAAGIKELVSVRHELGGLNLMPTIVCTAVSFVVGYLTIAFLLKFLQQRSTTVFVIYRIALGIVLLLLLKQGVLQPLSGQL